MPDEQPTPAEVAAPVGKARKGPAMSPERYREVFGGKICERLEKWEKELARVEKAIAADGNPRTHNHVTARRQVAHWKKQVENLTEKHNGRS